MNLVDIEVDKIIPYINNPRNNDDAVDNVAASIKEFGFKVPLVIDKDNVVVTGHTRLKAAKKLGLKTVPCIYADDLTEQQIKAFRLADNKVSEFSTWDLEKLDIELEGITDLEMVDFGFFGDIENSDHTSETDDTGEKGSLVERFGVPPFSVLDTRQGYWNERKRAWIAKGINSGAGRSDDLIFNNSYDYINKVDTNTSVFDPVLTEIMYKWFCTDGGKIYDCFAGGSVRGIVAEILGYKYTGIDLRKEQIDENYRQAQECGVNPNWICENSLNADKYIKDESVDMVFTCPPYFDLEKYSDDPNDLSNMKYDDFKQAYKRIFEIACRKLKDNRFAVVVVGDIRDKKGFYRGFVDYTKECLWASGMQLYNELILVEPVGSAAVRAPKTFGTYRKIVKTHQNILVFYKGDVKKIKDNYTEIEIDESLLEENADKLQTQ